jgi:hypothetical protein
MTWIIAIILLVVRTIYLRTGYYQVFVKTQYTSSKNDNEWMPMKICSYSECTAYIRSTKGKSTSGL